MIRVESIRIIEFRGIRDLTLNFQGKNFAVCGPNGTGKSGVVDAIEFALTGNVSRLSGEGRGDVSLKIHGPHVDMRSDPDKALVIISIKIPVLDKSVTIKRNLKTPANAIISTSDPDVLSVLKQIEEHPEIVLSRRELIRYVIATPGKRAEEIQALLRLDQIEQVRLALQKIANACDKQLTYSTDSAAQAKTRLLKALEISELTKDNALAAINVRRTNLGLAVLGDLNGAVKDGMAASELTKPQRIQKAQTLANIGAAREALAEVTNESTAACINEVIAELKTLIDNPAVQQGVKQGTFYRSGLELVTDAACPFCDTHWNPEELKKHVLAKVAVLEELSRKCKAAELRLMPVLAILRKNKSAISVLTDCAGLVTPPISMETAKSYGTDCGVVAKRLETIVPSSETISLLMNVSNVSQEVLNDIAKFEKVVVALPEPTKQDAARDWLTVAQERIDVYRAAIREQKKADEQSKTARSVSNIYVSTSDTVLAGIYSDVEKGFVSLYGFMNRDDEEKFKAQLKPSMGKVGFDVDFYGRGFFPPGAYHSEGHQDGMGLCLYLALMRHLRGTGFTFAVLDDVLMSVDTGHRREVCALLKKEFPGTQFIMTTHDPIWLRHMKTEKLIDGRAAVQFRSWDVDHGPTAWDDCDVWTEIDDHLKKNDVRAAAALLRHHLEYISAELCHRLRAPVEYRGDARYQLGELFPAAIHQMRKLHNKAKDVANSWNQNETVEQIANAASEFGRRAAASGAEQWQVNVAVHYNSWDNLGKEDFIPVVNAFRQLLGGLSCPECGEYLRVSPERETPESLRCECGKTNMNLRKKEP